MVESKGSGAGQYEPGGAPVNRHLVGRLDEVEVVRTRVREAAAGRPGVVLLSGADGVGKSSLLALVSAALRDEAEVLLTTCADGPDFAATRGLFEQAGDLLTASMDGYSRLSGLTRTVMELAAGRPLVLVLDDAHRCDAATARWLGFLARRCAGEQVCVILAHPSTARLRVETLFSELTGALDVFEIPLGPLGEADVWELLTRGFGVAPHDDFVCACIDVCGNVPGVSRLWIDLFLARGVLPDQAGAELLRAEGEGAVADRFLRWLAERPEQVRRYATAVAVIGNSEPDAVGALFGLSSAAVKTARTTLTTNGVLTEDGRFVGPALRDGLLGALDPDELSALRARAALLLRDEAAPHANVAELVMALPELSEVWMFGALREAALEKTTSPDVAIGYMRRVLAAVPGHVDTRLELAAVLTGTDPAAALATYAEVLPEVPDVVTRASVAVRYGLAALRARRSGEAFPVLLDVLRELPSTDRRLRARVEEMLLVTGYHDLNTVRQTLDLARGITLPGDLRTAENKRLVHQLARAEILAGGSVAKVRELTRLAMLSTSGPHDFCDLFAVASLHVSGDGAEAMALADKVLESAAQQGDGVTRVLALTARAAMKVDYGELADAEADAEKALITTVSGTRPIGDFWTRVVLASVAVRRGENDRAEQLFVKFTTPHDPIEHGWAMATRARWLRNSDDPRAALEVLLRCGREFDEMGVGNPVLVPWWVDAATLLVESGRTGEALELAERFRPDRGGWDTPRARGYALLAEGTATGAVETLELAVSELAVAGARLYECQALTTLGMALLERGQDKAARKHLREAVDLAVRCGDIAAANVARSALVSAGGRMGELSATPLDALTGAERRVVELAAERLANREIADALFVTMRTVEGHLSNAYRKLGVQTRADLAARLR